MTPRLTDRLICKRKNYGEPEGYLNWHEWAEKKAKTHKQVRCKECGKYHLRDRDWETS